MSAPTTSTLIAVDVGNSRIKLGRFDGIARCATAEAPASQPLLIAGSVLPEPSETFELPLADRSGQFDADQLAAWCDVHVLSAAEWIVCSVHRGAAEKLTATVTGLGQSNGRRWSLRRLTYRDVPLAIEVDARDRVGVDRLFGALAADRLRRRDHAAIVVDFGTAITVDVVTAGGAFAGGAILPGPAMSARALEAETDALPRVAVDAWRQPPEPLGKSTVPAIEAGLFWGAVGAVRELIGRLSVGLAVPPDVFVTGGGGSLVADTLAETDERPVRYVPHLVLAGIAIGGAQFTAKLSPGKAGG